MKMNRILISIILCVFPFILFSQTNFKPGYVLKNNGDTLFGEIDFRVDLLMSQMCKFRSGNKEITTFYPGNIKGYRFIDGKFYISQEVDGSLLFLEYLIKGTLSVFYVKDSKGERYYISKNEEIKELDNKKVKYKSNRHKGILSYYMGDAPELTSNITKLNKPDHNNLIKLAEDYHNIVCKDDKCIIYEKKMPVFKVNIEPSIGVVHYTYNNASRFEYGGYIYLWLPRANENFFLKTGLTFHSFDKSQKEQVLSRIPLQFEYIYPSKNFRPKLSFGVNLVKYHSHSEGYYSYDGYAHTFSLNAGFNYKIFKSVYYSLNICTEYFEEFMKFSYFSTSLKTGIYFQL
jgi:hypothetical protein